MSINIPAETSDESTNPISVEEFERLHPAMLGAIREVIREELAAWEEQPVFDHPQDMLLGGSEDWHPRFKVTPAFGDGRFLLTIQLGTSYGLSFHCDAHDLLNLVNLVSAQALKEKHDCESGFRTMHLLTGRHFHPDRHEHPARCVALRWRGSG